jgi:hypothetical protein
VNEGERIVYEQSIQMNSSYIGMRRTSAIGSSRRDDPVEEK